jgi:mycofactocin glycosyltransferase
MRARLPEGFLVRLGRHTRVIDDGAVLVGGSPTRVARLKPAARGALHGSEVTVTDAASRALAEHLLETGMADPVVTALPEVDPALVTVVIPVRDRTLQLDRLLSGLGSDQRVLVVDDASHRPDGVARIAGRHGAELIALAENAGPAGARNAGLAEVRTPYVVFVDSDVVVGPGAIATMLRHFADPGVAMVAPRVLGAPVDQPNWITRYEDARSSLDQGDEPASVRPRSPLTWVSSTCLVARVDALGAGFDERMRVGEDVDLVWRLVDDGWRVRFEPAATVRHVHRGSLSAWLARKAFYGTGATPLAERHPDDIAPAVLRPWSAGVLLILLAQRWWSLPMAGLISAGVALRIAGKVGPVRHPHRLAARLTASGLLAALAQGFALLLRHWWPLTVIGCLVSRRMRRAVIVAAVADTAWEAARTRPALDPVRFGIARRLDDLAYGAGVWWSAVRGRSFRALLPSIRRRVP